MKCKICGKATVKSRCPNCDKIYGLCLGVKYDGADPDERILEHVKSIFIYSHIDRRVSAFKNAKKISKIFTEEFESFKDKIRPTKRSFLNGDVLQKQVEVHQDENANPEA